ncbi:MAG: hypothetical protein BroJett039_11120 [Chloroflexota bacterium]|nr:MAG: hypothetical protein BroJett039_11120 [Chloroflexota bacterium]
MIDKIQTWLTEHVKSADDVGVGFAIAMFVSVGLGSVLNVERLVALGAAFFGAAVIAWGVNALQTRELRIFQRGIRVVEQVQEILARAWGLVFIGGGVFIMGYGVLSMLNPRAPVPERVQQFFGAAQGIGIQLLVGSAVGMLCALTLVFASDAQGGNTLARFIVSLPGRLLGAALFIFCAVLATLALLQIFAPDILVALGHAILQRMGLE